MLGIARSAVHFPLHGEFSKLSGSGLIAMVRARSSSVVTDGRPFEPILSSRALWRPREQGETGHRFASACRLVCREKHQIYPCFLPVAPGFFEPSQARDTSVTPAGSCK